jgi:hypothetical protein
MKINYKALLFFLFAALCAPAFTQTHVSVPLENQIYYILEQAQLRGLCSALPGIRPYTQSVIVSAINEILYSQNADKLTAAEREILERYLSKFSRPDTGLNLQRGGYYNETLIGNNMRLSANLGVRADIEGSTGLYSYTSGNEYYFGFEIWLQAYLNGDIGGNISYSFTAEGGLVQAPRKYLGMYNIYYNGFDNVIDPEFQNKTFDVYSEPLTHFPYSYKKRWDGSVFASDDLSGFGDWPNDAAGSYGLLSELTASFFDNRLILRAGRLSHEWGSAPLGSSLAFNKMARPFYGIEAEFSPFSWFSITSLTGALEYYNTEGIKNSSMHFQNAFSATMLQFRYKNYLFFDFVDAVVYPKRFEPGYISPIISSFFYQNNIGDFDNMAMYFNIKAQYPGIGNIWISLFLDDLTLLSELFELDRQMLALQAGLTFYLPFLSFSSIKFSYTIVNPYCYTHNRNLNPWYGDNRMETSYTNNGVGLGYYLPPNSDELLVRFDTMPIKNITTYLQYQMIRHGADFGPSAVDGSNLLSELDPKDRSDSDTLKRFFLQDGAYQWLHIIKIGGEWTLEKAPLSFYWEIGTVISYFTNTKESANSGKPYPYERIDTSDYPVSTSFIARIGIRVFPR